MLLHQVIISMTPMVAAENIVTALDGEIVTTGQRRCQQNQQYNFLHYLVFFPYFKNVFSPTFGRAQCSVNRSRPVKRGTPYKRPYGKFCRLG